MRPPLPDFHGISCSHIIANAPLFDPNLYDLSSIRPFHIDTHTHIRLIRPCFMPQTHQFASLKPCVSPPHRLLAFLSGLPNLSICLLSKAEDRCLVNKMPAPSTRHPEPNQLHPLSSFFPLLGLDCHSPEIIMERSLTCLGKLSILEVLLPTSGKVRRCGCVFGSM